MGDFASVRIAQAQEILSQMTIRQIDRYYPFVSNTVRINHKVNIRHEFRLAPTPNRPMDTGIAGSMATFGPTLAVKPASGWLRLALATIPREPCIRRRYREPSSSPTNPFGPPARLPYTFPLCGLVPNASRA